MTDVNICESWARDGLQSWPDVVPTDDKSRVLKAAIRAGIREIDATSLVPARYAPQFADADELLEQLNDTLVSARVLAPNVQGVGRAAALAARYRFVETVGFPISASEPHNLANLGKTHEAQLRDIAEMVAIAHGAGLKVIVAVATAFGCPIIGHVPQESVFSIAHRLAELGVDRLMLSDTTGLADPRRVIEYTERAKREFPNIALTAHFHDTRGTGLLNTWAAVTAGVTSIDSSLGGIGGEPDRVHQNHAGETGNVSTEDLVVLLQRAGVDTGVDVDELMTAGRLAEEVLGTTARSQVLRTGHGLGDPDPAGLSMTSQKQTEGPAA